MVDSGHLLRKERKRGRKGWGGEREREEARNKAGEETKRREERGITDWV